MILWSFSRAFTVGYSPQLRVSPTDENKIYLMGLDLTQSADGGKTWKSMTKGPKGAWGHVHGDHHALWIDPTDANYIINGNDGGVNVSLDGGVTWRDFYHEIPTTQFYNVTYDSRNPYYLCLVLYKTKAVCGCSALLYTILLTKHPGPLTGYQGEKEPAS